MQIPSNLPRLIFICLYSASLAACDGGAPSPPPVTNNLTASGLLVVSAEPRVGYPLEIMTYIDAEETTEDVSVSYFALNKSDVDRDLDEVRQFFLATETYATVEPSVTGYSAVFTVPADVDPPGDYVIRYTIDPAETIGETAEDDNSASGEVRLASLTNPNIFIEELTLDSAAILLYDDVDDVEQSGEEIEDVQNSDAGATLVVSLEGAVESVDVEATVDLRITRDDLAEGQNTYDVPMYLWDSDNQKYVDAYGLNGPPEWLAIGTLVPQIDSASENEVDFNTTDHISRTSLYLDVYFPGRLAFEMRKILEGLVSINLGPLFPPPDLTDAAIAALKIFFSGAIAEQVSFSIVAKVRARAAGFNEDVLVDNEASEEVFLILPGEKFFPSNEPLAMEKGTKAGFENKNFGVGFEFNTTASVDERGAIAEVSGGLPVTIFENEFDFLKFGARGQVVPASVAPDSPNSGFGLDLDFGRFTIYSINEPLGFTYEYEPKPNEVACPVGDNDSDGFLNDANGNGEIDDLDDVCPNAAGWDSPPAEKRGCPVPDVPYFPPTGCPAAKRMGFSKMVEYNQLFFVGPVPFSAGAEVLGEMGFELYADIQPLSLASKAGPFVELGVTITGAFGIPRVRAGVGGTLTLIDERFHANTTTGLLPIIDEAGGGGFQGYAQMSVTNSLFGPQGELFLFADYPGVKWCSALGRTFRCGVINIRSKLPLANWQSFVKEDVLFDETLCKAVTISPGPAFSDCS